MFFSDYMKRFEGKKVRMFVDMDGVIADYNVGDAAHYDEKRPLYTNISKLEELSHNGNFSLHILSISRMHEGIKQKNDWLDKFAPFFIKEKRVIIAREDENFATSKELKSEFLLKLERDDSVIIVIDDDPAVLKMIGEKCPDIVLLKDTVLVD